MNSNKNLVPPPFPVELYLRFQLPSSYCYGNVFKDLREIGSTGQRLTKMFFRTIPAMLGLLKSTIKLKDEKKDKFSLAGFSNHTT